LLTGDWQHLRIVANGGGILFLKPSQERSPNLNKQELIKMPDILEESVCVQAHYLVILQQKCRSFHAIRTHPQVGCFKDAVGEHRSIRTRLELATLSLSRKCDFHLLKAVSSMIFKPSFDLWVDNITHCPSERFENVLLFVEFYKGQGHLYVEQVNLSVTHNDIPAQFRKKTRH
jgi:hypothetical protein